MELDTNAQLRNLKDFFLLYNKMTENCFKRCIDDMNSRYLNKDEQNCVDYCSAKFISTNHRVMSLYVDVQTALVNKRVKEAQEQEIQQAQVQEIQQQS